MLQINYGLHLFSSSKKSILEKIWEERDINQVNNSSIVNDFANSFKFTNLELIIPKVPVKEISNLEEAKELFTHTHKWLKRARFYYSLRDYPLQYVNIMLELSELYRFLAFYEKTIDDQYDIQKKRYETLETLGSLVKEIRPTCYFSVSVEVIKEIMEVQVEMMNLNLKKLYNPNLDSNLGEQDLRKRVFTVIDMSSKMNTICTENKDDCSDMEFDTIIEPDQDDKVSTDEEKPIDKLKNIDEVPAKNVEIDKSEENCQKNTDEEKQVVELNKEDVGEIKHEKEESVN